MNNRTCLSKNFLVILLIAILFSTGCEKITGLFSSGPDPELVAAYNTYRAAMLKGDMAALRNLVVKQKAQELDAPGAEQMLALARSMYPANATVTASAVQGEAATLSASANTEGGTINGVIHLLKENGAWKIYDEKWEMKIGMQTSSPSAAPAPENRSPDESQKTAGAPSPASSFSKQDPNVSGEAIVVKDGKTEMYPLKTGFFSDTRFKDPSRARIQFQAQAPDNSNARRIDFTLDATKTGIHYADGKLLSDNFMSSDKIKIGEQTPNGLIASFTWVADGGQIFFPKTSCTINITSAYTGSASSLFSGEILDCQVHSAGIDYNISSAKFSMKGAPAR